LDRASLIGTVAAALVLAGFSAHAQSGAATNPPASAPAEVVSTAPAKASPGSTTTDAQIADWIKGAPPLGVSDGDDDGVISIAPDKGVHGEAGAFVSNRGYGGYVAATMPVGKDATLGLAVADTQYTGRYFRGNSQSLAASLAVGKPIQRPVGCPAGVQVGDHYVEPLWASRMRGAPLTDDTDGCFSPTTSAR
jgi:hypothetical protein